MIISATQVETVRPRRPDFAFMRPRLSRWIAFGLGSGLSPIMPGTAGTLAAWLIFVVFENLLSPVQWFAVIVPAFVLGVWACERTGADMGAPDHGAMVWDEFVAFWLVLAFVPHSFGWQFGAFVVFRFFDMVKPPPIRYFDRNVKGGFGVMLDDILAAFYTLLVLALWK